MMELEVAGKRTPIPVGELTIGADASSGLKLTGVATAHAAVTGAPDGSASVRRIGDNDVLLNGVKLGAEPAPILHGDRVQIGIHEILVHDPRRSGSTQFVSAAELAKLAQAAKPGGAKPPTAATGGRLVCLTDGREYTIGAAPLVIGREAGCDIVVPNKDVSRRHAEIFASPQGYVLVDSSTNGTLVNGERIDAQRLLARADVIKVGDHEFRFYADKAVAQAPAASPPPVPELPIVPPPGSAPEGAPEKLSHTMHGVPAAPPASPPAPRASARSSTPSGPTLATFLVRSGALKGQRLPIRVPVVNIGRAEYNDLVLPDDSVSGSHAKLQRREGVWILVDNGSTNGTYVDGERVSGEAPLGPGTVVRFGEISVLFEPTDDHLGTGAGSGTKVMGAVRPPAPSAPPPAPALAPTPPPPMPVAEQRPMPAEVAIRQSNPRRPSVVISTEPPASRRSWVAPVILIVVLGIVAAILFLRSNG